MITGKSILTVMIILFFFFFPIPIMIILKSGSLSALAGVILLLASISGLFNQQQIEQACK